MIVERPDINRRWLLAAGAMLALPLPACTKQVTENKYLSRPTSTLDMPRTQAVLEQFVAEGRLPGLTVGVTTRDGKTAFVSAGSVDFDAPQAVDPNTIFRIYSMTKLITGAAAALLIEDGKLSLDQPVSDFIPEFASLSVIDDPQGDLSAHPASTQMTVRHLLTHTSGLTYAHSGQNAVQQAYARAGIFMTARGEGPGLPASYDEMIERLAAIPLLFEPGERYEYGISIDVLAVVIERAAGMPYARFVQERILDPLQMQDTVWSLDPADRERLAAIYNYGADGQGPRQPLPALSAEALSVPVTMPFAGSGLLSTASDYLDFLSMLLNDGQWGDTRIMAPETAQLLRSDILTADIQAAGGGHGFGGWVARAGHPRAGEFGWSGNASTQAWIDPAHDFGVVLMMQALPYRSVNVLSPLRAALDADLGITR